MASLCWAGVWDSLVSLPHPPCSFPPPGAALPQGLQTNLKPRGGFNAPQKSNSRQRLKEGWEFCNINHSPFRALPGPEEVEAGSVPSPLG